MKREKIAETFGEEWVDFMAPFVQSDKFPAILKQLREEKADGKVIFPEATNVFAAFRSVPLSKVRIVVLGQDPYPLAGYANGLAFSHVMTKKVSPSLEAVIDAIEVDCHDGLKFDKEQFDTTLQHWVDQGILLLNTAFTVREKEANSHADLWHDFTEYVAKTLSDVTRNKIFLAWGKSASKFIEHIHFVKHYTFATDHPSNAKRERRPWDCKHFSLVNTVITANELGEKIKWMTDAD